MHTTVASALAPAAARAPTRSTADAPIRPQRRPMTGHDSWQLTPRVPQTNRPILRRIGLWIFYRAGWHFEGALPDLPKFVIIVAHHTSNWDFPIGLAVKWALGLDVRWLGKDTLFRPPLGWFMRANGGVPVNRASSGNLVERTAHEFATRDQFVLVLAPEGTRKRATAWRSGFWHVAKHAGVPICCVAMDWGRRVIRMGPTITADEDDPAAGIARVRSYFADVQAYDPSRVT